MKSYDHCEYEHERIAFRELEKLFPTTDDIELYPNFELFDESKKTYLECDLLVVSKNHCAVVELKHWRGEIFVSPNLWYRNGRTEFDPHRSNNRKCKILKSTIEKNLPATQKIPFVHSIVVLTNPNGEVSGADTVNALFKQEKVPAQITFDGIYDLAMYFKRRANLASSESLSNSDFSKVKSYFDKVTEQTKTEYSDQIPGFSIVDELEHTDSYSSYLAKKIPSLGDMRYRLRVFGVLSDDPTEKAKQVRSLKELENINHKNIHHAYQYANEKKLVVEVTEWLGFDTLEQRLGQVGQILWEHAAGIALGVAQALKYIHNSDRMLVHRNVSPKSIILNSEDTPLLTDFDLVYDPIEEHSVFVTPAKEYLPYLAPEIHQGNADPKSDVYSWGVTLFTMLAGEPPKKRGAGSMPEGLTSQHLAKLPEEVPESLRSLLIDSMKYLADERPESDEVVVRLKELLSENTHLKENVQIGSSNTWVLCDLLAEGSTSEVYIGDSLGEKAVLKLFKPDVSRDRCLHERDILLEIDTPGVPKYKRFFQWEDGRWCLALEYIEGDRLRDMIRNGTKPSLGDFSELTVQLLVTLSSMHPDENSERVGVIHNDINPNNILFNSVNGQTGLIDFGAASAPGPVTYRGTQGYIAPDLLEAGELDSAPSGDIYGLGVTLWEWLVGTRPSQNSSSGDIDVKGLSSSQNGRLYDWLRKCFGGESDRFESADLALSLFRIVIAEDAPVLENESPKVHDNEGFEKVAVELEGATECSCSNFVDYLNSIHNVTASNTHALAEAQAVNPYFSDIYEPFGLVSDVCDYLTSSEPVVLILTGHAGDGKSTIALDVLKKLKGIPDNKELDNPPLDEEIVALGAGRFVKIVKDMSELSAERRLNTLKSSLGDKHGESVSWLIVSNTGPLLSTFSRLKADASEQKKIEDEILGVLNQPIEESISSEDHCLNGFSKPVLLVNLAKLNNVDIASKILGKIVGHPSWDNCISCQASNCCHIALNIRALRECGESCLERVRWIYTRLASYGQRMTLRQMSSHLAYSLTAGLGCEKIKQKQRSFTTLSEQHNYLALNVFSDVFFGGTNVKTSPAIASLYCLQLLKTHHFGAHSSPQVERSILGKNFNDWVKLPDSLQSITSFLLEKSSKHGNIHSRQSLRRLIYMFSDITNESGSFGCNYYNQFLKSSRLIELESWARKGAIVASSAQKRNLLKSTLAVLLEEFSGFSIGQYGEIEKLYITLKRSDSNVHQPSQLVLAEFTFDEFDLLFDEKKRIPKLIHKKHKEEKGLELFLPLLDYITSRGAGDLDCGLDPIYTNQFEHFRSQLLTIKYKDIEEDSHGKITLIKSGIEGDVKAYSYELSEDNMSLEGL